MTPASRDPRVVAYGVVAVALVGVALATGEPVLAAGAAPFVVVLMMALRDLQPRDIDVSVAASSLTPLEGDDVTLTITVPRQPGVSTHVELELGPSWDAEDRDQLHLMAPPDGTDAVLPAVAQPRWWGRTSVGAVLVTHRDPEGLVLWEQRTTVDAAFRVLPPPTKVRELLPPPMSHALIGVHSSRLVGDGFDFAELRPYQDGDRLRDINWAATARYGEPHVNRRHPERNGDVVLVLDTYTDAMGGHSEVLQAVIARAARAAWSICRLHLQAHDRVGLVARGRIGRTVPLGGGDRARYRLLEAMLDIGGSVADGRAEGVPAGRLRIPPAALVIALTTLVDERAVRDLIALHAGGRAVVAVVIDVMDDLPAPIDQASDAAMRLFAAALHLHRDRLVKEGVPVTTWHPDGSLSTVLAVLRHLQGARVVRR